MGRKKKLVKTPYDLTGRVTFRASGILIGLLQKWSEIYQEKRGEAMTPDLLSRKILTQHLREWDRKLEKGEIDLNDENLRLPGE